MKNGIVSIILALLILLPTSKAAADVDAECYNLTEDCSASCMLEVLEDFGCTGYTSENTVCVEGCDVSYEALLLECQGRGGGSGSGGCG